MTGKLFVTRIITSKLQVRRIIITKLPVRRIITGKLPVTRQICKLFVSRVITGKFSLDLMKLRTLDLNLVIDSIFRISLLILLHSLAQYGKEDVSTDLVLAEKVFIFF